MAPLLENFFNKCNDTKQKNAGLNFKNKINIENTEWYFPENKIKENIDNDKNNIYRINVKKNTLYDSKNSSMNYSKTKKRNRSKKISKKQSTEYPVNESLKNDNKFKK